jgi:hypothetical protein
MPEPTARSERADSMAELFEADDAEQPRRTKRPLLRSFRFWIPITLLVVIIGAGIAAWIVGNDVATRAFAARDSLQRAIPLATTVKDQILAGDTAAAQQTATELSSLTADARTQADGGAWRFAEGLPVIGVNLVAVRTVAGAVDDLVAGAVEPATGLSIDSLAPRDGRVDTAALTVASGIVDQAAVALADSRTALDGIDREGLIDQVAGGVTQLDEAVAQIEPLIAPAQKALAVLPGVLGAQGPRNYLVLVQNNAESRGTGGNPAALVLMHVEDGAMSIQQQASSRDFDNGRAEPVAELDPATLALYGAKVGRYMMDVTTTPDFPESARIMGAFWQESFGTPIDGTLSIDPVALSFLLQATGPVTLPNGDVLAADNVVATLLSDVYQRFDSGNILYDNARQDAYFAAAAGAVFDAVTSVQNPRAFIDQVVRAVEEGRILYAPTSDAEAEIIAGSRLTGILPTDNSVSTVIGAYINDVTEGKLDFYLDTAVTVASDVCSVSADAAPTFTVTSSLTSTLQPGDVAKLPNYVSPARFFPKGVISTDVVLYGPVGATFVSASVDGASVTATPVQHLSRPAVKVNVLNDPGTARSVSAVFTGVARGEYGPIKAWYTPMVRSTPVNIDTPGCPAP